MSIDIGSIHVAIWTALWVWELFKK